MHAFTSLEVNDYQRKERSPSYFNNMYRNIDKLCPKIQCDQMTVVVGTITDLFQVVSLDSNTMLFSSKKKHS